MKITKTQLKQIIKEELSNILRENEDMPMPAEEEVTHEEVIEKVQELPQGALAQIWEFIKAVATGDPSGIMSAEELADFRASKAKDAEARLAKYSDPSYKYGSHNIDTYEESRNRKKTKK